MAGQHILIVDDEPEIAQFVKSVAESYGDEAIVTTDAQAFKSAYLQQPPDVIFLDVVMPDCDGIELMCFLAEQKSRAIIYVMSGHGKDFLDMAENFCRFQGLNIARILQKPFRLADLSALLKPLPVTFAQGPAREPRPPRLH